MAVAVDTTAVAVVLVDSWLGACPLQEQQLTQSLLGRAEQVAKAQQQEETLSFQVLRQLVEDEEEITQAIYTGEMVALEVEAMARLQLFQAKERLARETMEVSALDMAAAAAAELVGLRQAQQIQTVARGQ